MEAHTSELHARWAARLGRRFVPGALDGFLLWLGYGLLEAVFTFVVPVLPSVSHDPVPPSRILTLGLIAAYAATGAVLTGGLQALLRLPGPGAGDSRAATRAASVLAVLTLLAAYGVNLLSHPIGPGSLEGAVVFSFLLAAAAASISSEAAARRLRFATRPLCVLFLLLAVPWAAALAPAGARRRQVALAAAVMVAVLLLSALAERRRRAPRPGRLGWDRGFLAVLAAVALLGIVTGSRPMRSGLREDAQPRAEPGAPPPNVVLVVMDTVRADHLSLYGYPRPTSPNLDRLAKQSTVYTNAISAASMTLATHASIFTGLYARRHGAHYVIPDHPGGRPLPDRFRTLAQILGKKGYATLGVAANYGYLGPGFGLDRGFAYYDVRTGTPLLRATMPFMLRDGATDAIGHFVSPCARDRTTRRAEDVDAEAVDLIDANAGRPFFLFLNYMDAHTPYCPPAPFDTLFPGKLPRFTQADYNKLEKDVLSGKRKVPPEVRKHLISQYDGGIAYLDHEVGRLVAHLASRRLLEGTLLIITSDHGEAFGSRGLIEHGVSVYQNQVHVPLVIRFPGQTRGAVVGANVSSVDLLPTILEVAGIPVPTGLSGRSLRRPAALRDRLVFTESYPNGYLIRYSPRFDRVARAVLEGPRKLIVTTAGRSALFDLADDPTEAHDLLREGGSAPVLRSQLQAWLAKTKPAGDSSKLDPAVLRRLRELGYVQ